MPEMPTQIPVPHARLFLRLNPAHQDDTDRLIGTISAIARRLRASKQGPVLQTAEEHQHQDDHDEQAQQAAWTVAPCPAMRPTRQRTQQGENQNDQQNCSQHRSLLVLPDAHCVPSGAGSSPLRDASAGCRQECRVRSHPTIMGLACLTRARVVPGESAILLPVMIGPLQGKPSSRESLSESAVVGPALSVRPRR